LTNNSDLQSSQKCIICSLPGDRFEKLFIVAIKLISINKPLFFESFESLFHFSSHSISPQKLIHSGKAPHPPLKPSAPKKKIHAQLTLGDNAVLPTTEFPRLSMHYCSSYLTLGDKVVPPELTIAW